MGKRQSTTAIVVLLAAAFGAVVPAAAAAADDYNDVGVSIPATIVLDGSPINVTATSAQLTGYSDKVTLVLYNGSSLQTYDTVGLNKQVSIADTEGIQPGAVIGRVSGATTYCSWVYDNYCSLDGDFHWYKFVTGLTYHDSAPATAKYGSKLALSGTNDGTRTTWTVTAQQYSGYLGWKPWSGAGVVIGNQSVTTDAQGVATWVENTSELRSYTASAAETATVWGASTAASTPTVRLAPVTVRPTPPATTSPKPGHIAASASATKAATAVKKGMPSVRKVVTLTKKNDVNKLLGKRNGYTSAAVLYDKRSTCSDGPGVDCGATIEKFTSTAKAKARAKHIQELLKRYSFLGTEHDIVHGHFLLRVTGDLTGAQAKQYRTVFGKAFR